LDRVVAVHEASHAVARFLVADDFKRPPEEMIRYIEVGLTHAAGDSYFNKFVTPVAQATTFGATFSTELQAVIDRTAAVTGRNSITNEEIRHAFTVARSEGIEVDRWLRARLLIMTFASVHKALEALQSYSTNAYFERYRAIHAPVREMA
jgi:hypothetical protein